MDAVDLLLVAMLLYICYLLASKLKFQNNNCYISELKEGGNLLSEKEIKFKKEIMSVFTKSLGHIQSSSTYSDQSTAMSSLVKSGIFNASDLLRKNTLKLFIAHREAGACFEGGVGVRITVQYNLFSGSVANLGSPQQFKWLQSEVIDKGELGCFMLTEKGAGVLSGLIVETIAKWTSGGYIINTPTISSHKTWISQGITSKYGVVIARLILKDNTDKGPHAFIVNMNTKGVIKTDMTPKTDFNGLDNAEIAFDNCLIPLDNLLSGISYITNDGEYKLRNKNESFKFIQVAQRLLSGRICIAGAGLHQLMLIINDIEKYCNSRLMPFGKNQTIPLSLLPVMRDELLNAKSNVYIFKAFTLFNENRFMNDSCISAELVDSIACGKIEIISYCISQLLSFKLRVGSYCLLSSGPFGSHNDILYVYRFAEGDSAILRQKMARDYLKKHSSIFKLIKLFILIPFTFLYNYRYIGKQQSKLYINTIRLAISMMFIKSKSDQMNKWFESYNIIERIAKIKALLTIYNTVYEKTKNTKQLAIFKKTMIDVL